MKLELFVSQSFAPCSHAERVWRQVAAEHDSILAVVDIGTDAGRRAAVQAGVTVVPAVVAGGRLLAVGVQSVLEARELCDIALASTDDEDEGSR